MNEGKLSSRPPHLGGDADAMEKFIAGAGVKTPEVSTAVIAIPTAPMLPWNEPRVRPDVAKLYNLRLPEPYLLKLKHIAEHTPDSMQQFCLSVLLPAIDARITELTGNHS